MRAGESGQPDADMALPHRPEESRAAGDASPFVPASQPDSYYPATLANPAGSSDAGTTVLPDVLGAGLGIALVACALLAFRIRGLRSEVSRLRAERDAEAGERARREAEIARLREVRSREVEHRTQRLTRENQALLRERRAMKESQSRLASRVDRDELTGLKERDAFERLLDRELRRALRDNSPVSVIAWTLDESHMLAQRLGQDQAARVLQRVAATLEGACRRGGDQAGRIGPTSFAAVLPGTSLAHAGRLAERVREKIQALGLPNPGSRAGGRLTVSAGLAGPDPATGPDPSDVLAALEAACTEAARRGGNQVVRVRMQAALPSRAAG